MEKSVSTHMAYGTFTKDGKTDTIGWMTKHKGDLHFNIKFTSDRLLVHLRGKAINTTGTIPFKYGLMSRGYKPINRSVLKSNNSTVQLLLTSLRNVTMDNLYGHKNTWYVQAIMALHEVSQYTI